MARVLRRFSKGSQGPLRTVYERRRLDRRHPRRPLLPVEDGAEAALDNVTTRRALPVRVDLRGTAIPGKRAYTCDRCGNPMLDVHCKLTCRRCGFVRDCSDP